MKDKLDKEVVKEDLIFMSDKLHEANKSLTDIHNRINEVYKLLEDD